MDAEGKNLDPARILARIDAESTKARTAMSPDIRLLYSLWGAMWVIGFLSFYAAFIPAGNPLISAWWALAITVAALAAAITISTIHSVKRGSGTRGPSMVQGAIFGNCFFLSFVLVGLLGWRLSAAGLDGPGLLSYAVAACALVVGALTVVGSLLWNDRSQLIFGGWILVVGLISLALPAPHNLLAGALGGLGLVVLGMVHGRRPKLVSGVVVPSHG